MPHHLIKCRLLVPLHPNIFKPLYIYGSNHLNHNYKVLITFHLGLHIENDGPHTPCSHAKKFKNVARGQFDKCELRNLRCVSQNNLKLIPIQVYMPPRLSNCFFLIAIKLGQRVIQNPCIHGHIILMPRAFFSSRWVFGLARLHNHIVACSQMLYQVALSDIGCITPINTASALNTIPCPMDTFYKNCKRGNCI